MKFLNTRTRTIQFRISLFYIFFTLLLGGCSSGGDGVSSSATTSKVTLNGSVGSGYTVASAETNTLFARLISYLENVAYAAVGVNVNTVTALRIENGALSTYSVINSVSANINADGTFSLSLDKNYDWVLLLMDKNATGTARFIGTVALNNNNMDSLLNLPTSSMTTSSIALGNINDAGSSVGMTTNMVNSADFSLSAAQLLTLAKTDDSYKNAKNLVLNYNQTTGVYYKLRPDFKWRGTYASLSTTASDPAAYTYNHYNFQLDSNSSDVAAMSDLCGTTPVTTLKIFPPLGTTAVSTNPSITYSNTIPITNDSAVCSSVTNNGVTATEASEYGTGGDFFASNAYGNISYSFGGYIGGTIPAGYWDYKVNNVLKGQFDISAVAPLAMNGATKGFSPAIKVNKDVNGKIVSVDITWYVVSANGSTKTLLAPSDLSILKHAISTGGIYFDNFAGTRRYESINFDPSTQASVTPVGTWYFDILPSGAAANELALGIGIFYESAGVGYFIDFFHP